jgi:glycosyltransferase involved in cell wall biosynthesis
MAAEKPIVSTPIQDVVGLYSDVVEIAPNGPGFVEAIERLWSEDASARHIRSARARALLAEHAWDAITARMRELIAQRLDRTAVPSLVPPLVADYGLVPAGASD